MLLVFLGICAIAAVLLQQVCNNTREGEEAKKNEAVARTNLFKHCCCSFSDEQSALLSVDYQNCNDPGSAGKQIRNPYYSHLTHTSQSGTMFVIPHALRKKWRLAVSQGQNRKRKKKRNKNLMTAVLIFALSFKFIAGFVQHRNNQAKEQEASWQKP